MPQPSVSSRGIASASHSSECLDAADFTTTYCFEYKRLAPAAPTACPKQIVFLVFGYNWCGPSDKSSLSTVEKQCSTGTDDCNSTDCYGNKSSTKSMLTSNNSPRKHKVESSLAQDKKVTIYIVLETTGGLGNKISALIGMLALARETNRRVAVSASAVIWRPFWESSPEISYQSPPRRHNSSNGACPCKVKSFLFIK